MLGMICDNGSRQRYEIRESRRAVRSILCFSRRWSENEQKRKLEQGYAQALLQERATVFFR